MSQQQIPDIKKPLTSGFFISGICQILLYERLRHATNGNIKKANQVKLAPFRS